MIKELLERHFIKDAKEPRKHIDRFYPTQSSVPVSKRSYIKLEGKCLRAAYYSCLGLPEEAEFSLTKQLIFGMGDYTESLILDTLEKEGSLFDRNVKFFSEKYKISGKLDAIILDENGKKVGLEVKSIGSNKYAYGRIYGDRWNKPFPKWQNLLQTIVYCYAYKDTIDKFILMYIRRDTCEIKEFEVSIVPRDGKMYPVIDGIVDESFCVDDILSRYVTLLSFISKKEIPPKEYQLVYPSNYISTYNKLGILSDWQVEKYMKEPFGDIECKFCGYANRCIKDK